jgi:hypothetical protein
MSFASLVCLGSQSFELIASVAFSPLSVLSFVPVLYPGKRLFQEFSGFLFADMTLRACLEMMLFQSFDAQLLTSRDS